MVDVRGTFWCDECRADFPDALRERHIASHATAHEKPRIDDADVVFLGICLALGGVVGLAAVLVSQL